MKLDDCIWDAILAGTLTLKGNRSVELRGLGDKELAKIVWDRVRPGIATLREMQDFETRRKQIVGVVTRCLTDVAFEFLERRGVVNRV